MNFIRKIIEGKIDDETHRQFTRYGKGVYGNKALIQITKKRSGSTIKTSFEFANEFVRILANSINGKTKVTGSIITIRDLRGNLGFEPSSISQFAGVKNYKFDNELSKEEILTAMDKFPDILFLLSFQTDYGILKVKPKSPKAGKSSTKEDDQKEVKADFCSLKVNDTAVIDDLAFDIKKDFSKAFIKHKFEINEIVVPKEYENDFAKARLNAKRKGKLTRTLDVDGKIEEKNYDLLV